MDFQAIATRFFEQEFHPLAPCLPGDYPHCPELAGTRLGALLKSFKPESPLVDAYNRLLGPDRLGVEGDVIVFCEESQAVSYWGVRLGDRGLDKPPVLRGENVEPIEWFTEFDDLDAYLSVFCIWQALNGAWPFHGFVRRRGGLGAALRQTFEAIDIPRNSTGLAFFAAGRELLLAEATGEVFVAARTEAEWASIRQRLPRLVALHEQ